MKHPAAGWQKTGKHNKRKSFPVSADHRKKIQKNQKLDAKENEGK
jgi:hypothetical protein